MEEIPKIRLTVKNYWIGLDVTCYHINDKLQLLWNKNPSKVNLPKNDTGSFWKGKSCNTLNCNMTERRSVALLAYSQTQRNVTSPIRSFDTWLYVVPSLKRQHGSHKPIFDQQYFCWCKSFLLVGNMTELDNHSVLWISKLHWKC